jgi:prevent-host-death family protein
MTIVMKHSIAAGTFKAKCLSILDEVQSKGKEYVITKRGKPVARLVPVEDQKPVLFGRLKGTVKIHGNIFSTGEKWEADA